MPYFFAPEAPDVVFIVAIAFFIDFIFFLFFLFFHFLDFLLHSEGGLLGLHDFLLEIGGLGSAGKIRSYDLVGVERRGDGSACEEILAVDGQDAGFWVDFLHEVVDDGYFFVGRECDIFRHMIIPSQYVNSPKKHSPFIFGFFFCFMEFCWSLMQFEDCLVYKLVKLRLQYERDEQYQPKSSLWGKCQQQTAPRSGLSAFWKSRHLR